MSIRVDPNVDELSNGATQNTSWWASFTIDCKKYSLHRARSLANDGADGEDRLNAEITFKLGNKPI
jgi:hypothetical protein